MSTPRTRKSTRLTTTAATKKRVNRAMDAMEMDTDANAIGDQNRNIVLKTEPNSRDAYALAPINEVSAGIDTTTVGNTATTPPSAENDIAYSQFFEQNVLTSTYNPMDDTSTDRIMEEVEMLLQEFANMPRSETLNRIFQTENVPDTTVGTAHSSDGSSDVAIIELLEPAASTSAASTNSVVPTHSIDDSVVFIDDNTQSTSAATNVLPRPTIDDDVILIDDEPEPERPQHLLAVVDLCSPDSRTTKRRRAHTPVPPLDLASTSLSESMSESMPTRSFQCPVCMEKIRDGKVHSTICGHVFCGECIKCAVKMHKKCPICNKHLTLKGIHPLYFP